MPLVQIRYRRETLNDAEMESLVDELPEIVADSLRCADTGGNITPEEVEIWVSEYGRFDRNGKSLAIVISTDRLPTLVAEKQPRVESIEAGVYMLGLPIDEKDGYVELVLADSAIAYLED